MPGSRRFGIGGLFAREPAADRRFRAYCVGTAKSGTHSLAAIFARSYAAEHEAKHRPMIQAVLDRTSGKMTDAQAEAFIVQRDAELALEMDSSQLNAPFVDVMARLFSDAKFILTIRDCDSFLHSITNHTLARDVSQRWVEFRNHRFGGFEHPPQERMLAERGLFTLDGYLSYWARHNEFVLQHVPPERLLVVRTGEIRQSIPQIARFLGIPEDSLDAEQSHSYPAADRFDVISQIDREYVEQAIRRHCGPLMRRFYPELMGEPAAENVVDAQVA